MAKTTMHQLGEYGQSIWLDYISRSMLEDGKLKKLLDQGLRGMTSNPSIFNQVISSGQEYDTYISRLKTQGKSTFEIYDALTTTDIRDAAAAFRPIYESTKGLDGYVSLEINPKIAHKVDEQIKEGLRLFEVVGAKNLMIKVPATQEGFSVIEELTANGVNVNATLIFSLDQYKKTAQAYLNGLTRFLKNKGDLKNVHSVASVFISRIDSTIDGLLDKYYAQAKTDPQRQHLKSLQGKAAVANSRIIYSEYCQIAQGKAFMALAQAGANMQRVLWGSTSTKNPQYSDIKYVTELIARGTVNTVPEKTLLAFLHHGTVKEAFGPASGDAHEILSDLKKLSIDINQVCADLLHDGVKAFEDAFESLLSAIEKKAAQLCAK